MLRSLFGVAFPLFTSYMYDALGIHWASSIPAFLALACLPFPFIFYRYGPAIRKRCKFAAEAEAFLKSLRAEAEQEDGDDDSADPSDDKPQPSSASTTDHDRANAEREAQREAEALDYSYGREEQQPEYAAIKSPAERASESSKGVVSKKSSRSLQLSRSRTYEGSPYDIDRINTGESFARGPSNSRAGSVRKA